MPNFRYLATLLPIYWLFSSGNPLRSIRSRVRQIPRPGRMPRRRTPGTWTRGRSRTRYPRAFPHSFITRIAESEQPGLLAGVKIFFIMSVFCSYGRRKTFSKIVLLIGVVTLDGVKFSKICFLVGAVAIDGGKFSKIGLLVGAVGMAGVKFSEICFFSL